LHCSSTTTSACAKNRPASPDGLKMSRSVMAAP
jgi:hypothetical protein